MIETLVGLLEKLAGSLFSRLRGRKAARRRRSEMLADLRCIYANQAWPRITAQIDEIVLAELNVVDESDLARRFELVQIALREYATAIRQMGLLEEEEIDIASARQHVEGLLTAVKAHGRAPSAQEFLDALNRLHTPYWLTKVEGLPPPARTFIDRDVAAGQSRPERGKGGRDARAPREKHRVTPGARPLGHPVVREGR